MYFVVIAGYELIFVYSEIVTTHHNDNIKSNLKTIHRRFIKDDKNNEFDFHYCHSLVQHCTTVLGPTQHKVPYEYSSHILGH
jgi:hypothetical protein